MIAHVTGTVVNGALQLDAPLALPDKSRVAVHIETLPAQQAEPSEAFAAFRQLIEGHPVQAGGPRPTRQELYERR
jgi:hypothetical protein